MVKDRIETEIKAIDKFSPVMRRVINNLKKGQEAVVGFNGSQLSTLFFGMEMQRIFGGALKSIVDGYKKIIPEASEFNKMTTRLSANWEFFKFQLADALATSPVFQKLIQNAISLVKAFQQLGPTTKAAIVGIFAGLAVLGGFLKTVAILKLGLAGLVDEFVRVGEKSAGLKLFGKGPLLIIGAIIAGLVTLNATLNKFQEHSDVGAKKMDKLKGAMKKIINSVIEPMTEGFFGIKTSLKDMNEVMIVVGAVFQNILGGIALSVNALIVVFRSLFNVLQIIGNLISKVAEAIGLTLSGEFKEAGKVMKDLKNSVSRDLGDIGDAWKRAADAQKDIMESFVSGEDINNALNDYRQTVQFDDISSKNSSGEVTNYYVVDGGVAISTSDSDERIQASKNFINAAGL